MPPDELTAMERRVYGVGAKRHPYGFVIEQGQHAWPDGDNDDKCADDEVGDVITARG